MHRHTLRRLLVVTLSALLAPTGLAAQANDPLIGTWKLDLSRSTFSSGPPIYGGTAPGKRVMTFEKVPDGIRHVIETTDRDNFGDVYRIQYIFKVDGNAYPADVQMPVTSLSFRRIDGRTIVRTGTQRGEVWETVTYQVSPDGRTLTATQRGTNRDNFGNAIPVNTVQVFTRQ